MWPWGQKKNHLVSVSLSPQNISCCFAKQSKEKNEKITIIAYERKNFASLEFEKSIVFNPTKISHCIKNFIKKNNIERPIVSLSVSGPNIFEKIITLSKSAPKKTDFTFPELQNINWSHTYLCPSTKGGFHFCVHGMPKETLFQYRLLAIKSGIKLRTITTSTNACMQLYKNIKGKQFTQNQLSIDLSKNNYDIRSIFTKKLLEEHFNFNKYVAIDLKNETQFVSTNLGLFLTENKTL